ncbi:MAG: serine/threonine protein kinase [Acidimicrobiia bacterium]|nr:serine/threonine protein kinase [Acidimicrobiia bacterium]
MSDTTPTPSRVAAEATVDPVIVDDRSEGRPEPEWLVAEPWTDVNLGPVKSGKEAQIDLIERTGFDGRSCLLALKRYAPRKVKTKGQLEEAGFERASAFRHDVEYREGRQFRKTRDRRAVERMSTYGKRLLQSRWTDHEFLVTRRLWEEGVAVPYPVAYGDDEYLLEFIGDTAQAAPQLAKARVSDDDLASAVDQIVEGLHGIVRAGFVHGDLSAYNLLWWEGRVWFIDLPQAVDLAANPQGLNYLHRDVVNICDWLNRRGHEIDGEELFAELVATAYG